VGEVFVNQRRLISENDVSRIYEVFNEEGKLIGRDEEIVKQSNPDPAAVSAVTRWRSMGFGDDEIIAMAPALADAVTYAASD
jgi:hypothetical protein